jgi:hypothetical protein
MLQRKIRKCTFPNNYVIRTVKQQKPRRVKTQLHRQYLCDANGTVQVGNASSKWTQGVCIKYGQVCLLTIKQ